MADETPSSISQALGRIPGSIFIMTSHHEERNRGVMVSWVQQLSTDPPMVMIALPKGRPIVPLLHDSHAFALCQVASSDRLTQKIFRDGIDAGENPFEAMDIKRGPTGSPIIARALAWMDCEMIRHIDVDGDHDIYVGLVRKAEVKDDRDDEVIIKLRPNGLNHH